MPIFGGAAAMRDRAVLDLLVEGLRLLDRPAIGEDRVGMFAGESDAGIGGARLENHRLALLRAADIQRPFDAEEAALVVEPVQLGLVDKDAGLAVADEGVVVPGIPQALDGIEIFVGDLVAQLVLGMLAAVVAARPFERRGHGIPAGAAAADRGRSRRTGGRW